MYPASSLTEHMIFEDPTQRRWKYTVIVFWLMMVFGVALSGIYVSSLILNPPLSSAEFINHSKRVAASIVRQSSSASSKKIIQQTNGVTDHSFTLTGAFVNAIPKKSNQFITAFLLQDSPESISSFKEHVAQLDVVYPDWFVLSKATCSVDEHIDADVQTLLKNSGVSIFPRVTNADSSSWHTPEINALLKNANERQCAADVLASFAKKNNVQGLNMDIETLVPRNKDNYLEFLISLAKDLHTQGQLLTVDVTANDPAYDMEQIGKIADAVVLMNYDEHYLTSPPGPIASQEWFDDSINEMMKRVPANKLLVAMGNYADDWAPHQATNSMTFAEVIALADDIGAEPAMDEGSQNMTFSYTDQAQVRHDVWFLNSVTAWNEYVTVQHSHVLGMGLWRLGSEDPTVWEFLGTGKTSPQILKTPLALRTILYTSEGEVFRLRSSPHAGSMDIQTDPNGVVTDAQYSVLPSGYLLERVGKEIPPKTLVLTFDDGPDPVWTPQIISALQALKVPAAFFLVGQQVEQNPSIISTLAKDGYAVGNHTYLHPDLSQISPERLRLELNSTQRAVEENYGRKTALFRPPYTTDSAPDEPSELDPLQLAAQMGYVIVGANIDPSDWNRPGAKQIADTIERQAQDPSNHIIVMHDAGGDRSQTVAALNLFIPALQKQGYSFVTIDAATGISHASLQPVIGNGEFFLVYTHKVMQNIFHWGWIIVVWLFIFTTVLAICRILLLGSLVLRSMRKKHEPLHHAKSAHIPVSILIPAYNEEKTLKKTIVSLQGSSHENFEILVIDDGSQDETIAVVHALQKTDPRIRLICQKNSGKAEALNRGMREATYDIIVTIDADTIMLKRSLEYLVAPFEAASVDAVCGNVEVGNVHNILTGFQSLEYITTQNFDRRAFDELNCISVVPGATGAWRREKILAIGGYTNETLTEDADLTLALLRHGGRIVYAPLARSKTEAPDTVRTLAKQRFRWSFGTFQCLWKHRDAFFEGTLGWVALPNMFFFQILFPILSPIGDAVFLLSIFRGDMTAIASGYVLFLSMDVCGSLLAFTLEKKQKKLMLLILIQRFFYRQFMYVITFQAIIAIFHGGKRGWNKLERKGSVLSE